MNRAIRVFFLILAVLPLAWMVVSSLKPGADILASPWSLPTTLRWDNFGKAWSEAGIGKAFLNSLLVTVATLLILMPISAMAAYVLASFPFRGNRAIFTAFLGGMMFPQFLVIVPLFLLLRDWHMLDTLTGLTLVYVAYSLSFTIFVLSGFFESLPDELAQAAMLDGCSDAGVFWRVMLPLAKPGLLVTAIFDAIGLWNEYGLALVLIPGAENRTLPLGIANLTMTQQYQADWGALFAGLVISMAPVMAVYWIFKDRIYEAMLAGSIK